MGSQLIDDVPVPVHRCPPLGIAVTPCCDRSPFELLADRMTVDPALVTCRNAATHAYRIGWWTHKWWPTRELLAKAITGRMQVDACMDAGRTIRVRTPRGRKPYWQALWRRARLIRRPHRPWQAEIVMSTCSCNARRAFTADGAVRAVKALHAKRVAIAPEPGVPVSGFAGTCWAALSDTERAACV